MENEEWYDDRSPAASSADRVLEVEGLYRKFPTQERPAVAGLDFSVSAGEMLVLLGPSGCGKTTLLRCIAGLEVPDAGRISLQGRRVADVAEGLFIPPARRPLGVVFQNLALWPHMTVLENVAYPLRSRRVKKAAAYETAQAVLEGVRCGDLVDRRPGQLSGGQQQRVALARALVHEPEVVLFDEPLSALDALLREHLRFELRSLQRRLGFTGIFVTHDQEEAMQLGSRIAVMREGAFEQVATPEAILQDPATDYVADFLGIRNKVRIEGRDGPLEAPDWGATLPLSMGRSLRNAGPNVSIELRCRPDAVLLREVVDGGSPSTPSVDSTTQHAKKAVLISLGTGTIKDVAFSGTSRTYVVAGHRSTGPLSQNEAPSLIAEAALHSARPIDVGAQVEILVRSNDLLAYADGRLLPHAFNIGS